MHLPNGFTSVLNTFPVIKADTGMPFPLWNFTQQYSYSSTYTTMNPIHVSLTSTRKVGYELPPWLLAAPCQMRTRRWLDTSKDDVGKNTLPGTDKMVTQR